jgi:hypothetical protein
LIEESKATPAGRILQQFNITRDRLLQVLSDVRGISVSPALTPRRPMKPWKNTVGTWSGKFRRASLTRSLAVTAKFVV